MNKLHKTLIWIAAIIGIFTLAMFGSYIVLFILCPELKQKIFEQLSSNIGDFMGGTVGVFLTMISTLFLFVTFALQRKQFAISQEDTYRTRFEGTFFNILTMLYNVRTEVNKQIQASLKDTEVDMGSFYHGFKEYYLAQVRGNKSFNQSMNLFRQNNMTSTQYETAVLDLGKCYDDYVQEQGCNAGFYFRYIHNLVSFVIDHWKDSPQDKHKYLNFIQAQLSDEELALIFYDSISNLGLDKQKRYTFKENLDNNSFLENISPGILLEREHHKVFPHTKFRFLNADELKKKKC